MNITTEQACSARTLSQYANLIVPLFSDHIGAACTAYEDLMSPLCIYIEPSARPKRLFAWTRVVWICDRKLARNDQMGRQALMRMRWIVRVASEYSQFHCYQCCISTRLTLGLTK